MSRNEIAKMTVAERVALMEELWASFDRDDLEYPTPAWHEKVLEERATSKDEDFISFAEVKKSLQSELHDA
ncbi:MAG TPA: hypothetical protein EYG82_06950 [Sulfurovum sp.]|nr:hypothetical protein [Sulfurovum sp.]